MHLIMILITLSCAWLLRLRWDQPTGNVQQRWQRALSLFLCPPLLMLMTGIAIVCMGPKGQMAGAIAGQVSYGLAWGVLGWASIVGLKLLWDCWSTQQQLSTYPEQIIHGQRCRIMETPLFFSAQIGFWQPELVVSQGLLNDLNDQHLRVVLAHEEAHIHYRDTFWFLGLSWIRRLTFWFPRTEALWQELLLLREMRADRWAAQHTDPLLLAEALLLLASAYLSSPDDLCTASLSCSAPRSRIVERVDALLSQPKPSCTPVQIFPWSALTIVLLPLLTVPFHY